MLPSDSVSTQTLTGVHALETLNSSQPTFAHLFGLPVAELQNQDHIQNPVDNSITLKHGSVEEILAALMSLGAPVSVLSKAGVSFLVNVAPNTKVYKSDVHWHVGESTMPVARDERFSFVA